MHVQNECDKGVPVWVRLFHYVCAEMADCRPAGRLCACAGLLLARGVAAFVRVRVCGGRRARRSGR
ncbi:hypothetical protein HMPREF3190_00917 [Umbribacter vaginalis]|nr:hypothetical protein HMPREF3190_00917 [Coriobacteriales bacterium DNF00809]